ncbi:MAG: GAF domain-containing protein, partial [Candidatus Eisenbacteria bacterium]|nr:GAF domain-containing protein [Candidatus Eisenbacteria bacterium]
MKLKTRIQSEVSTVRELLVAMAAQTDSQALQDLVVGRLASTPPVALARLWLLKPGESCSRCVENVDLLAPLHLAASAGEPNSTDANYHCFALGQGKIGHIAASGEPIHLADNCGSSPWISAPEWARREGIRGFGGYPVVANGETLGVLAIFTKTQLSQEGFEWLGTVAHQLAGLLHTLDRQTQLIEEVRTLRDGRESAPDFTDLTFPLFAGCSSGVKALERQTAITVANREPVFIQGERGTGKGHLARHVLVSRGQFELPPKEFNCDELHTPDNESAWLKAIGNKKQTVILHHLDQLEGSFADTLLQVLNKDPHPDRFVTTCENDLSSWREDHPDLFHT